MPELSDRVATFTDSVIRRMTRISNRYGAVNLSQGFPDFDPPKEITDALARAAKEGPHQYSITFGAQNFREAVAEKQGKAIGRAIDPDKEIVVTCGSTEAMMCAMMTICNPGDRVMVFSPFYENYGADAVLSGAKPIYIPLVPPDYHFDLNQVEQGFRDGAKALILCNPSNPCGKVFTRDELLAIGRLALKYDAFVVTDEVYEHLVYAPAKHICMASLPGMFDHTITCNSLSKTYSITGWRLGYAIAPQHLMDRIKQFHDFNTVGAPSVLMEAAIAGLEMPDRYYEEFGAHYAHMKALFTKGLDDIGIQYTDPQGAYFVLANIGQYLKPGQTDVEFCEEMARKVGVACVPGTSFFKENVNDIIRVHFAKKDDTLMEALNRLADIKTKMA